MPDRSLRNWTVICYKEGSYYKAVRYDGVILKSSVRAEDTIKAALRNQGTIYFAHAQTDESGHYTNWNLSSLFTGFTISGYTTLIGSRQTRIKPPYNFNGTVFTVSSDNEYEPSDRVNMEGIIIREQEVSGAAGRNWTGIKFAMNNTNEFIYFSRYNNIEIHNPNIGIEIETISPGFFNSNRFEDVTVWQPRIGFLFDLQGGDINGNIFSNCQVQSRSGTTTYGFKDVDGQTNTFIGCVAWDFDSTAIEMNIKPTAINNTIIGGKIGELGGFIDSGYRTTIINANSESQQRFTTVSLTPDSAKQGAWYGSAPTSADGLLNGRLSQVSTGTGSSANNTDTSGIYRTFDTGSTTNSLNGYYCPVFIGQRSSNVYFKTGIRLNNNTNMRVFAGLVADAIAPTSSADPLNAEEGVGLWLDTAVSANWKIMHNDGSGASTIADTGVAAATGTLYKPEIFAMNDNMFRVNLFSTGHTDLNTNIPASTSSLGFKVYVENTTGASRVIRCYYIMVRSESYQ